MIKAIIIDDEVTARNNLAKMLELYCPQVEVVFTSGDVQEASDAINNLHFNLLFLDINLGVQTGFELLENVYKSKKFSIIFTTAYEQYALKAFEVGATDYLLKPIYKQKLIESVQRVATLTQPNIPDNLMELLKGKLNIDTQFVSVYTKDGNEIINPTDILFFEASRSYTKIKTTQGKELYSSKNLKHYDTLLESNTSFIRPHKSYIINKDSVVRIVKKAPSKIVLSDGSQIPISENMKNIIYSMFQLL